MLRDSRNYLPFSQPNHPFPAVADGFPGVDITILHSSFQRTRERESERAQTNARATSSSPLGVIKRTRSKIERSLHDHPLPGSGSGMVLRA